MAKATGKKPVEIISEPSDDADSLPPRVAAMRDRILDACAKGDIEALRMPIDWNELRPLFERSAHRALGESPIERLKALSFDGRGAETLAILRAILRQSFVTVTNGPTILYVWPAFSVRSPIDPTPRQREQMLACVRFADLANPDFSGAPAPMEIAIGADGTWHYYWTSRPRNARG